MSQRIISLFNNLLLFVVVGIHLSCKQNMEGAKQESTYDAEITHNITYSSFKQKHDIALTETGINGFFGNITQIDTFLICPNYRSPIVLQVYNINTHKLIHQFITRGELKGQCLSVAGILPIDKTKFWLYDITLGKLLKIDIIKALSDTVYWGDEEIILTDSTKNVKSPYIIGDGVFSACTYTRDDCRFITFNKNSTILGTHGRLPSRNSKWPDENKVSKFNILASIYTANIVKHPTSDIIVAAYNKTDRIEIYKKGTLKKVLRGPDQFDPAIRFTKEANEIVAVETEKTRFSYTSICASNSFFYCLYSGTDRYNTCTKKILVFDWDGNPVKTLEFDRPICYFTVSENEGKTLIYVLEKDSGTIFFSYL